MGLIRLLVGAFIASEASSGRYPRVVSIALSYLVTRAGGLTGPVAFAFLVRDLFRSRDSTTASKTGRRH